MFWNLIAVFTAGIAAAGIVHLSRRLIKKLPSWSTAAAAGAAMLAMQISIEYQWFAVSMGKLPPDTAVLAKHEARSWWRPWSYAFPVTERFIALSPERSMRSGYPLAGIYLMAKNEPPRLLYTEVDCTARRQRTFGHWEVQPYTEALLKAVCS